MDRCHDTVRAYGDPEGALVRESTRNYSPHAYSARAARASLRQERRRWIVDAGTTTAAATPMWTSRSGWLAQIEAWLDTRSGRNTLARLHLRAAMLLRVAEVLAAHADHATGQHCAVTNAAAARAARCSPRTVTTVRVALRESGFAAEIRRGTGSSATPSSARRPSVWHLVSRSTPVHNVGVCHLPPSLRDRRLSPVRKRSPSGRIRPPQLPTATTNPRRPRRQRRRTPRALATQKLAAALVAGSTGLGKVHPGHICNALTRSGLELPAWTARQLLDALNADMRILGWSWPDHIHSPGAFLLSRLRRLPATPPKPAPKPAALDAPPSSSKTPASAETRASAKAFFLAHRKRLGSSPTNDAEFGAYQHRASKNGCAPGIRPRLTN